MESTHVILAVCIIALLVWLYTSNHPDAFGGIYFDNNATMRPYDEAVRAVTAASYLGNGSSTYATAARNIIVDASYQVREVLGVCAKWPVIWTSGASESNNLFLRGVLDNYWYRVGTGGIVPHLILSSIEHKTSLLAVEQFAILGRATVTLVGPINGFIEPADIAAAITPNTLAISVMHANNETGILNNVADIAAIAHEHNIIFHTDATQSLGKVPPRLWPSGSKIAISASMHKIGGPTGVGCLVLSPGMNIIPQITGSQNSGMRGGTENIAGIAGAKTAIKLCHEMRAVKNDRLFAMRNTIAALIADKFPVGRTSDYTDAAMAANATDEWTPNAGIGYNDEWVAEILFLTPLEVGMALPNTLLLAVVKHAPIDEHFCNIRLKHDLADDGVIVSIGSACNTKSSEPSHVLMALKLPYIVRCGVIRVSLGDMNTIDQCYEFVNKFTSAVHRQLRKKIGLSDGR